MCDSAAGDSSPRRKRFIESSSFYRNNECADPFAKLKIRDSTFLEEVPQRSTCPRCNRSRKYYCYTCYVAVEEVSNRLPIVNLPIQIDIIKHPKEVDGKSTSAHAAVLAPSHVRVYTYPDIPIYQDEEVILIFPSKSALPLQEWWQKKKLHQRENSKFESEKCLEDLKSGALANTSLPFKRVVFIDSTWRQSKALYSDPRLKSLPCALLTTHQSLFWRYYRGQQTWHLSTVEAIYYFLVDLHTLACDEPYDGRSPVRAAGLSPVAVLAAPAREAGHAPGHGGGHLLLPGGAACGRSSRTTLLGAVRRPALPLQVHVLQDQGCLPTRRGVISLPATSFVHLYSVVTSEGLRIECLAYILRRPIVSGEVRVDGEGSGISQGRMPSNHSIIHEYRVCPVSSPKMWGE